MNASKLLRVGRPVRRGRGAAGRAAAAGTSAVVLLTGLAAGGVTAGAALAARAVPPARAATAAAVAGPASSGTVLLINGDRVVLTRTPSGLRAGIVRASSSGLNGSLVALSVGGKTYDIPADALPFLNRGLSPALFELGSLQRLESGGRLPVRVGYRARLRALPGVTITRSGGGTALGYLTDASAKVFGAALARQVAADHARGSYGSDGIFAGGVSIGLVGQPTASPARPLYPMRTLTVTGTDRTGRPDTGDQITVLNVDNPLTFSDPVESFGFFYHGTARFSVPVGHYLALGFFIDASGNNVTANKMVILPQVTVAGNTAVAVDERAATDEVQIVTPRPSILGGLNVDFHRVAANGSVLEIGEFAFNFPLWMNRTTRPVTVGALRTVTTAFLNSPAGVRGPYEYDLAFAGPNGVIGPQRYVATAASLATVHENYFQDATSTGGWIPFGFFAFQSLQLLATPVESLPLPFSFTRYVSASRSLFWLDEYLQVFAPFSVIGGGQTDAPHTFVPGEVTTENWNAYPQHPTPNVNLAGAANPLATLPSASRQGNTLWLDETPFGDNTFGHTGDGFAFGDVGFSGRGFGTLTGSYELDQNGKKIAAGNAALAAAGSRDLQVHAGLSSAPATVRFVLTATRTGTPYLLSTTSQTAWTWRSARHPGARLPAGWRCGDSTRSCSVEPMMSLLYQVRGLGLDGSAPPGRQGVQLSVGHVQLASAARVTGATAQVSFDDGRTWQSASVTSAGGGRFEVAFTAAAGAFVSLRVQAADAAGGQIAETIIRGYRIAGRAAAGAGAGGGTALAAASGRPAGGVPVLGGGFGPVRPACRPAPGHVRCLALFARQEAVNAAIAAGIRGPASQPVGLSPQDLESAYRLPVSRGSGQTVAVVEAFSTPALAANLAVYRSHYRLPACTAAGGCLRIVNQNGKASPLPASAVNTGWDVETMLDVSMVSAACPHCKILVVEANNDSLANLAAGENSAARLGAQVISNSYGFREGGFTQVYASAYDHPGHVIVASSGDIGFTATQFPANLATVTAAGGTVLARARNARGWSERVWHIAQAGASGSGCSAYVAKPSWQHDAHCAMRTVADVAAVAWNVPIYEKLQGGWLTLGGTSVSAPLIAGVYALAGNAATIKPGYEYTHARSLFDITTGNNDFLNHAGGATCGFDYLCVARKGYDAPTGLGTPDGAGAF